MLKIQGMSDSSTGRDISSLCCRVLACICGHGIAQQLSQAELATPEGCFAVLHGGW